MIASLSMYDWPAQSAHWDALWGEIRDCLRDLGLVAPDGLTRGGRLWDHWESPDLILGQTCGMPFRTRLYGNVTLIGALDHALPEAPAGFYYSNLVVHRDSTATSLENLVDGTLAYNGLDSESGWAAAQNTAADHGFQFSRKLHTGSHRNSALAVANGRADIAAIDAETWRLITQFMPETTANLRVLSHSEPTPGLPLITSLGTDAERISQAIDTALTRIDPAVTEALHIRGFERILADDYLAVRTPPMPSQDAPAA